MSSLLEDVFDLEVTVNNIVFRFQRDMSFDRLLMHYELPPLSVEQNSVYMTRWWSLAWLMLMAQVWVQVREHQDDMLQIWRDLDRQPAYAIQAIIRAMDCFFTGTEMFDRKITAVIDNQPVEMERETLLRFAAELLSQLSKTDMFERRWRRRIE